jgi:L-histidine Nalpha-methyltransferase
MLADVREGLSRQQKELSPKYFYDERGSALFDEITRLPEYYPTRTERALLSAHAAAWLRRHHPRSLIELGAGSADKTRVLLDAMTGDNVWYIPIDISITYLAEVASRIGAEYPHLRILPVEADLSRGPVVPPGMPKPAVIAFLGGTIGNFDPAAASQLLTRVQRALGSYDRFLLGVDLKKDIRVLEAAYNDARGVTAAFNRNVLDVLNRELGADFEAADFDHVAFYNAEASRIEMHLAATRPMTVHIPGMAAVLIDQGETIRTEISTKYDRPTVEAMFATAGLEIESWMSDALGHYALVGGKARP